MLCHQEMLTAVKMFYSLFFLLNLSCYQAFLAAIESYKASGLANANKQSLSPSLIMNYYRSAE